jgi:hypothetical protein
LEYSVDNVISSGQKILATPIKRPSASTATKVA